MLSLNGFSLIHSGLKGSYHADFVGGSGKGVRLSSDITAQFVPLGSDNSPASFSLTGSSEAGGIDANLGGIQVSFNEAGRALDFRFEKWTATKSGDVITILTPGKTIFLKKFSDKFMLAEVQFDNGNFIEYQRDADAKILKMINHVPSGALAKATQTIFSWEGEKLQRITDQDGHEWSLEYSPSGEELEGLIEPTGGRWVFGYRDGRIEAKSTPGGRAYNFRYNANTGAIEKIVLPGGFTRSMRRSAQSLLANSSLNPTAPSASRENYDPSRRLQEVEALGHRLLTINARHPNGLVKEVKDAYAQTIRYEFEGPRIKKVQYVDQESAEDNFLYDAQGYLIRTERRRPGQTLVETFERNASFPYLVDKFVHDATGPAPRTVESTFDNRARLVSVKVNGVTEGAWEYNDDNRVVKQPYYTSYGYHPMFFSTYEYLASTGHLGRVTHHLGSKTIVWNVLERKPSGAPTKIQGGPFNRTISVSSNELGQLIGLSATGGSLSALTYTQRRVDTCARMENRPQ